MQEVVLVIDVGTSKVHANTISVEDGSLVSESIRGIPWHHPQPGWTECSPEDLWTAVVESVRETMSKLPSGYKLIAISNSFQGDGHLLEDKDFNAIHPVIVAMDGRGVPYVKDFAEKFGAEKFSEILGCPFGPWEPMKYYWMVQNHPELIEKTAHITSVQEYELRRLGLGYCQDYTLASRKVMRDYRNNCWSKELCDFIGLPVELFDSPIYESSAICGKVRYVGDVDLGEEVPVIVGAHDCEMGMFGVGVVPGSTKVLANVAGTTDHLGIISDKLLELNGGLVIYQGPFSGSYVLMGANAVGASTSWGVNNLFPEQPDYGTTISNLFKNITFDGKSTVIHTGGVQAANGIFRNIDLTTTREDIFKALIEGVTYPLQDVIWNLEKTVGSRFGVIRIGNGGAKSKSWLQLKANLFDTPVETVVNNEISSVGATALAAVTLGRYSSVEEAQSRMIQVKSVTEPDPALVKLYKERVEEWKALA